MELPQTARERVQEVLAAFEGGVPSVRVPFWFRVRLFVVSAGMVLLPLGYGVMVAVAAWLLKWGVVAGWRSLVVVYGRPTGFGGLLCGALAITGTMLVIFLAKPLFRGWGRGAKPVVLTEKEEPALFALIHRTAELCGAPRPVEVRLDCGAGAAAIMPGLRGWRRGEVVLTLGLPLVAGVTTRQLAGVLAHEFGYFPQDGGMRARWGMRAVNAWLDRAVEERDPADSALESLGESMDFQASLVARGTQVLVWMARLVLRVFRLLAGVAGGRVARQLEHEADACQARVAGSEEFPKTLRRLRVVGAALSRARADLGRCFDKGRLPENLVAFMIRREKEMSESVKRAALSSATPDQTRWSDCRPSEHDRIRAVRDLALAGVFRLETPASGLFLNFDELCCEVTRQFYEEALGVDLRRITLVEAGLRRE